MDARLIPAAVVAGLLLVPLGSAVARGDDEAPPKADLRAAAHHAAAAAYNASHGGRSLLVMVNGEVVFEDYPNGGSAETASALASGTKSFSGAMVVAAAADGLLTLDEKVSDTITEWKGDGREAITIRHLLSLTSGIDKGRVGTIPTYAEAIEAKLVGEPGAKFEYGPVPYQVFGELLRRKLAEKGEDPLAYLTRRVLEPIGLEVASWTRGADGNPRLPSGASLTAREWAKYGELIRKKGQHGEQTILDPKLLEELFVPGKAQPRYGLTFWLGADPEKGSAASDGLPADIILAAGAGKQRMAVSRELELVVVRQTGRMLENSGFEDAELLSRLLYGTSASGGDPEESPPSGGARRDPTERAKRLLERNDKDGDGALTKEEIPERLQRLFDRADADRDGKVTEAELKALLERRRGQ